MIDQLISEFDSVSLEETLERAELLTRIDNKYVLSEASTRAILASLITQARVLEINGQRKFQYRTTYFDTPELTSFYASAHKRRRKFKVRAREYCETSQTWFEVKTSRDSRVTRKDRIMAADAGSRDAPENYQLQFAEEIVSDRLGLRDSLAQLERTLTSTYQRVTLLMATGERMTIDLGLQVAIEGRPGLRLGRQAIVETKSTTGRGVVDRALWSQGMRPQRISKSATGLALLKQELPHNRWNCTIRDLQLEPVGADLRGANA